MTEPTELLVDVAAVMRFARLMQDDKITQPMRDGIAHLVGSDNHRVKKAGDWAMYLSRCPWCMAVWGSAAVMALRAARGPRSALVVRGLAVAEIAGRARHIEAELKKAKPDA